MKSFQKLIAFILILNILFFGLAPGMPGTSYAAPASTGLISRAEVVGLLNNVFALQDKEVVNFYDVPASASYADAIYKAVTAGIIKGYDDGTFRPNASISRQEAAVLMVKAFGLTLKDKNAAQNYSDYANIPQWSRDAVAIMAENSYMSPKAGNRFAPVDSLTYAEATAMIDTIAGKIVSNPGSYAGKMPGNLLLNTANITLDSVSVQGNLVLAQGIGDGQITLNKVNVAGNIVIRGGGENSIYINNSTVDGTLIINKKDGRVRVITKGSTGISNTLLYSGAILREEGLTGKGFGNVEVDKEALWGSLVKLDGSFGTVSVSAPGANIQVQEDASVSTFEVKTGARDSNIESRGKSIGAVSLRAKTTAAVYKGTVGKIEVQENAASSKITIDGADAGTLDIRGKSQVDILSGTVKQLDIDEMASGTGIYTGSGAAVTTFNAHGNADVTGQGNIYTANISADNVVIEKSPAAISIAPGVSSVIGGRVTASSNTPYPVSDSGELTAMLTTPMADRSTSQLTITFSRPLSAATLAITDRNKLISSIFYDGSALATSAQTGSVNWSGTTDMPVATIYTTSTAYVADHRLTVNFIPGAVRDISGNTLSSNSISVVVKESESGNLALSSTYGTAGQTNQTLILTYTPGETLEKGSVTFLLPSAFGASAATDTISIAGSAETALTYDQMENSGQKVIIRDLNLTPYQSVVLKLINRTIPAAGYYSFSAKSDADGDGTQSLPTDGSGNEAKVFVSSAGAVSTAGTLVIEPDNIPSDSKSNITLTYTAREVMTNGSVTFLLPNSFTAAIYSDTYVTGGISTGLSSGQITNNGHTVTVYDINIYSGQTVKLNLLNKTIPAPGTYYFSATADVDGPSGPRASSLGTGTETAAFVSGRPADQTPPVTYNSLWALTISPSEGLIKGTVSTMEYRAEYTDGTFTPWTACTPSATSLDMSDVRTVMVREGAQPGIWRVFDISN